jgi:predicted phosphodiesterase
VSAARGWKKVGRLREKTGTPEALAEKLGRLLRRGPKTLAELSTAADHGIEQVEAALEVLRKKGFHVRLSKEGGARMAEMPRSLPVGGITRIHPKLYTGRRYRFGVVSDNHLGSKYARLDVLNALYDLFAKEGVRDVFNCGNWVDGMSKFNQFDLVPGCESVEGQLSYFVKNYPRRKGIKTHFIAGDDHEGWWTQKVGMDVGRMAQERAEKAGREDLKYLAYLEADVRLEAPRGETWLRLMHPGGGSVYAVSYVPQKIVESFQGGEKPAVLIVGHHHKLYAEIHREVWCIGAGCTEDQTPFMRKKKIEAHVGGALCEIEQARDGHVAALTARLQRFFDRGFYEHKEKYARW